MVNLLYLYLYDEEKAEKIRSVSGLACCEDGVSFLGRSSDIRKVKKDFGLVGGESFDCICEPLEDYLNGEWEGCEEVTVESETANGICAVVDLSYYIEETLQPYDDDDPDYEKNIQELLSTDDWYEYLLKQTKILVLTLLRETITQNINSQIEELNK